MRLLFALASLLVTTASAAAEPVRVASGFYSVTWGEESFLDFIGSGFEIEGNAATRELPLFRCHPCAPGDTIDLGASFTGSWFNTVTATLDGTTYAPAYLAGEMQFSSGTIVVPHIPDPDPLGPAPQVDMILPFTFTASLRGFPNEDLSGDALFSGRFSGSGRAILSLINNPSFVGLYADRIEYQFQDSDPIPEPATVTLLAIGISAAAASRARQRRRRAKA